jgi:hypothetical protein
MTSDRHRNGQSGPGQWCCRGEFPGTPLYLVTYMNFQAGGRIRSATVVSVTNQSKRQAAPRKPLQGAACRAGICRRATSAPPSSRSRPDEAHAGREQPDEPGEEP